MTTGRSVPHRLLWIAAMVIGLTGAPLVAIGSIYISARGTALPIPLAAALAGLAPVVAVVVFVRRSRAIGAAALVMDLLVALFLTTYGSSPLPKPVPLDGTLPPASPPAAMALLQLPTGVIHRTAAFGYRGGAFSDRRNFAMTAALVKHPRGDLLIDTGLGRGIESQLLLMLRSFRMITDDERGRPAADQLDAAGYDRTRLRGILLTHAQWDHVSGTADFPGFPCSLPPTSVASLIGTAGSRPSRAAAPTSATRSTTLKGDRISASREATTSSATARSSWSRPLATRPAR